MNALISTFTVLSMADTRTEQYMHIALNYLLDHNRESGKSVYQILLLSDRELISEYEKLSR